MITITTKNPKEFAIDEVGQMSTIERINLDLFRPYEKEYKSRYVSEKIAKATTLPLDSVWEREHEKPIRSIYTYDCSDKECKKNMTLRQIDKVLLHISPEEFNLEKRVCYPNEILSYSLNDVYGPHISPSNGSHCVSASMQYQIVITSSGNMMVKTMEQYSSKKLPEISEIIYLNAGGESCNKILNATRKEFLKNILEELPSFHDINLLTDKEHGREIRIIVPNNGIRFVYETLKSTGYNKLEK